MGYNDESAADKRKRWEQAIEQGRQKAAQGNRYKQYMEEHFGITAQQRQQAYEASGMDLLRKDLTTLDNDLRTKPMLAQRGRVSGMLSALQKQRAYFQRYADYFTPEELQGFDSELRRHEALLNGTMTAMEKRMTQKPTAAQQPKTITERAQTGAALGAPMGQMTMPIDQTQRRQLGFLTPQEQRAAAQRGAGLQKTYGDQYDVDLAAKKKQEAEANARQLYERKKAYVEKREAEGWNSPQERENEYRRLEYYSRRLGTAQAEKMRFARVQKEYGEAKTMENLAAEMQKVTEEITASQERVKQLTVQRNKAEHPGGHREGNQWVNDAANTEKMAELDQEIKNEQRRQKILEGQQKRVTQDYQAAYYYKYTDLQNRDDFAEKSQYRTTRKNADEYRGGVDSLYKDVYYDYINGDPDAQTLVKVQDDNNTKATHEMWKDLPEETVGIFNYLYATEGKDAAYEYLDQTVEHEYTWMQSIGYGLAQGTGLASVASAVRTGAASFFGGEDAKKEAIMDYRTFKENAAAAAQQNPVSYYAGSTVGNLGLMAASGGVAGKAIGTAGGALGSRVATGALSFATAQAIRDAGNAATGEITAGEYGKNILVSGIQGAAGNLAYELVSSGIAKVLTGEKERTYFMEFLRNTAASMTFSTVNQAIGYLAADEKPTAGEVVSGILSSFAFAMIDGGLRTLRTTRAAKQELEQMYNDMMEQYTILTQNGKQLSPEQAAERVLAVYQYSRDLQTKLDGTYLAGQEDAIAEMQLGLDSAAKWAYDWIAEYRGAEAATAGSAPAQSGLAGGMLTLPETAGQAEPSMPTQPQGGGAPEQEQKLQAEIAEAITAGVERNSEPAQASNGNEAPKIGNDVPEITAEAAQTENAAVQAAAPKIGTGTAGGVEPETNAPEIENTTKEPKNQPETVRPIPAQEDRKEGKNDGERAERLSDRNGGRLAGTGAGRQAGSLGTGRPQGAAQQSRTAIQRQNTARSLQLQKVSSRELGLEQGTDEKNLQIFPIGAWDDELKETVNRLEEESGKHVTVVLGQIQIKTKSGLKKVRGVYNNDGIILQADNLNLMAGQIGNHELMHHYIRENPGLAQQVEDEIVGQYGREEMSRTIDKYIERLRGVVDLQEGMTDREYNEALQRVKDEIICDAYAGINAFGAHAERYQEPTQRVMQRRGIIREPKENVAALARRGVGDDGERYSIERTADNKPFVDVEQDILAGVPKENWVATVKENLMKKFPDGVVVGNNEIQIDGRSRQEMTFSRYMQWLYNNDPKLHADKLRATNNADEILQATTGWVNEGLNHPRKDRIVDFSRGEVLLRVGGNDYTADVVVGTRKNGSMALYDVLNLQPTSFKAKETDAAISTNPSPGAARSTASVSENSIRQEDGKSQGADEKYSLDEEETAALLEKKKKKPVAESLPIIAKRELKQNLLNLFSIPQGMRAELGGYVDHMADRIVKNGALTQDERDEFFDQMYANGVMEVAADEYYQTARQDIIGRRIYVPENVKHEFGDDWNRFRREAFSVGVVLTNQRTDNAIDSLNMELAENMPGLFDATETDSRAILERIVQMADEGKSEQMSLNEYAAWLAGQDYVSEDEVLDNIERQMDWALRTFAEKAGLEIRLRDRTGVKIAQEREKTAEARMKAAEQRGKFADRERELKEHFYDRERKIREREALKWADERKRRKELNQQQQERRELRELQQRTLKQLQWLAKNQYRAPEELRSAWDEVLSDIDIYAVGAANAMNYSNKYGATWKDLAEMYKAAKEEDPNFLPSKELEYIVARLDNRKIEDMDLGALQDLYKAAVGLRTEFYNRNNVIGDLNNRKFEEVYADSTRELRTASKDSGAKAARNGGKISKFLNQDQLSPMNVMQRMGGWNPNGTFYSMAKQLEKGERDIRAYTVKANRELEEVLTEYADFVRRADGQGKDAIWYEIEVPELMELGMGDKPIFGETVKVYMTPSQKIHMYLESKSYENLRHMAGGRTFADKELYSKGKRSEAFAQGKTIRLAPETVKALVSNLTPEEQAIADALQRYYNQFAKREINRVSNLLYGYDKAVSKNYAPIYTNTNYTKSELGVYNATAEGVGNLKQRQYSKNPSYNIGAFDAFERHVEQTARFVGMAVPARNWQTLLNWRERNDSMADVITHNWGESTLRYIQDLLTNLQAGTSGESDTVSSGVEKFFSNYISAVFGANPSIVLKQLGSIPLAGVWLDFKNLPSIGQIRRIDRELISKYTQELAWRTMGYSSPETKQLKENPNWTQRNKATQFWLGGGAITAMDGWAASVLWPWAENKVRREFPELELGTEAEINNGESKFYKKVAEVFDEAVARSQSTSDEMHQGTLRKSKNPVTRAFTMFKSDASQTYNAWRQTAGEARHYKETGNETAYRKAKRRVGIAFLAATGGYLWAQGIAFLINLWKYKGKAYRDDEGNLTFGSVAEEMALGLAGDLAGVVAGGEEIVDIIGNIVTGDKWYGIDTPGMEQMNDVIEMVIKHSKGIFGGLKELADIVANDGDVGEYLHRNSGGIAGGIKELAETIATYVPGISVSNLESYLLGTVRWASPELATAYEDALQTSTKGDLKGLTGDALAQRVDSIFSIRNVALDADAADAVAELYEAGFTGAVPVDTPSRVNVDGEDRELSAYQQQVFDKVWSGTVDGTMQELLASEEFAEASDAAKEKMLKGLYSYAGEQAKAVLFEDYTADTAKADAVLQAGASMTEWLNWLGQSGTLEPEDGKDSVSTKQKYELLRGMGYSDKVKYAIAGSVGGTEMETDSGGKSQYAKMLDIQKGGLSADKYLDLRINGAVDKYLKQKEAGANNTTAYQMAMALDKLPEKTKPVEKWRTAVQNGKNQKEQLAALKGVMTEVQYDKVEIASYYKIEPDTWVQLNEMMPDFDEDGNGSYKKDEIENAIEALGDRVKGLGFAQKAALWQLMTGSTNGKNNPYSTTVGEEIVDERKKRKEEREKKTQ